jgi:hypothetical protein
VTTAVRSSVPGEPGASVADTWSARGAITLFTALVNASDLRRFVRAGYSANQYPCESARYFR